MYMYVYVHVAVTALLVVIHSALPSPPACQELPESLDDLLLPLAHDVAADMYVIGTQESTPSRQVLQLYMSICTMYCMCCKHYTDLLPHCDCVLLLPQA